MLVGILEAKTDRHLVKKGRFSQPYTVAPEIIADKKDKLVAALG